MGESVGFDEGLAVGESVDEDGLAVGESVGFDEELAVGESVDEGLAVGESVGFDEGLAVGESFDEGLAVGESVGFDEGLAFGESFDRCNSTPSAKGHKRWNAGESPPRWCMCTGRVPWAWTTCSPLYHRRSWSSCPSSN